MKKELNQKLVTLAAAVVRGEKTFNEVTLTKPNVTALKGLKMFDVMQMDVDSYITLLPRISQPALTKADILALDPVDFTALCTETLSFFVKAEPVVQ